MTSELEHAETTEARLLETLSTSQAASLLQSDMTISRIDERRRNLEETLAKAKAAATSLGAMESVRPELEGPIAVVRRIWIAYCEVAREEATSLRPFMHFVRQVVSNGENPGMQTSS